MVCLQRITLVSISSLKIVCYTGGTCGDLITAMIDCRDIALNHTAVIHSKQRQRLKKPTTFIDNKEKDDYIQEISTQYDSIPSHDLDYHVNKKHQFISITVNDPTVALWAATRFKQLHRPHVWEEMQRACGSSTIKDYAQILIHYSNLIKSHTDQIITLESIKKGNAVKELEKILQHDLTNASKNLYSNWLQTQMDI